MDIIIDRIENDLAVCENDSGRMNIPLSQIKGEPKAGDVLIRSGSGYTVDEKASEKRRSDIIGLQNKLWK